MRKHSARKWLHFVLDLLPILVLPIFAIYEINHDHNTPIEVVASENKIVNFNQLRDGFYIFDTNLVVNDDDQTLIINGTTTGRTTFAYALSGNDDHYFDFYVNHKYYIPCVVDNNLRIHSSGWEINVNRYNQLVTCNATVLDTVLVIETLDVETYDYVSFNCMVYDFTLMFGEGNEPTIEQFNTYFPNIYYPYTYSEQVFIQDYQIITYDNTDIGSQMMYALYKPVKEYFNFNNVFNFGDIYRWFEVNMFGGNAPMPIFIVWNIIVYQFLMDLMFLVYSIFMFIIDFTSECLERCFSFSRHGGSR